MAISETSAMVRSSSCLRARVVSPARARGVPAAFQQAVATGDLQRLLDLIAPDVVLPADGGGVVPAALEPVVGAHPVADVLRRIGAASL